MPSSLKECHAKISALNYQLNLLAKFLWNKTSGPCEIPPEVAIELQHMLVHLVSAGKMAEADYISKSAEIGRALGHLDRAFLDACKNIVARNFLRLKSNLAFMRHWVEARQKERAKHFRDQAHDAGAIRETEPLELVNHACRYYARILEQFDLIASGNGRASRVNPTHNRHWQNFAQALDDWFRLDLLYTALICKKSYGALNILISCLWTLDAQRLKRLNLQIQLDILVVNGQRAHELGWNNIVLKKHIAFLRGYACIEVWQETDLTPQRGWIQTAFHSLCRFYGSCADWPAGYRPD